MSLLRWSAAGLIAVFQFASAPEASAEDELCKGKRDCRPLTSQEVKYVESFFGDMIDYDQVRIVNRPSFIIAIFADATAHGSRIHYHDRGLLSSDHSKQSVDNRAILVHEMMHVVQDEVGIKVRNEGLRLFFKYPLNYSAAYKYELDRAFHEYNVEQQAKIVEDYAYARDLHSWLKSEMPNFEDEKRVEMKDLMEKACAGIAARYEILSPYLPLSPHKCNLAK
jgi:hypothetical protein